MESRISRLEGRLAIRELCSRYARAMDEKDLDGFRDLFTADMRFGRVKEPLWAEGRDTVIAVIASRLEPTGPSFHVNHDQIIEWTGPDCAAGVVSCHAETSGPLGHLVGAIRYHDRYRREGDGVWRLEERLLGFLYYAPVADYPGLLMQRDRLRTSNPPQRAHWPEYELL